jgi:hypothetical protein
MERPRNSKSMGNRKSGLMSFLTTTILMSGAAMMVRYLGFKILGNVKLLDPLLFCYAGIESIPMRNP